MGAAGESVFLFAMVVTRHKPKEGKQKGGRRLSNYEKRGDGKMAVLSVSKGSLPDDISLGMPVPMQFRLKNENVVRGLRAGNTFLAEGYFEELTKKSKIYIVTDITIESRDASLAYRQKHGVSPNLIKELAAIRPDAIRMEASGAVEEDNGQDIASLVYILGCYGIPVDIDIAKKIDAFFSLRAKKVSDKDSVASLIKSSPMVLAEYPDDTGNFTCKTLEEICRIERTGTTSAEKLCAVIASTLQALARRGNVCWGANSLYAVDRIRELHSVVCGEKESLVKWIGTVLSSRFRPSEMKNYAKVVYDPKKPEAYKNEYVAYYKDILIDMGQPPEMAEKKAASSWNAIYLVKSFFSEFNGAVNLASRIRVAEKKEKIQDFEKTLSICSQGLSLDEEQIMAVKNAFNNMTSVIVGAAGTGKTTVVRVIARIAQTSGLNPVLLAPSATAAAKMAHDAGGIPYSTIHRFVGILPEDEDLGIDSTLAEKDDIAEFSAAKLVIVDEMSMCQLDVFARLLSVMKNHPEIRLVLVGDEAQLPAIGLQFFHQITAGIIPNLPVARLETVYRANDDALVGFCDNLRHGILNFPAESMSVVYEGDVSIDDFLSRNSDVLNQQSVMVVSPLAKDVKILNTKIRSIIHKGKAQKITGDLYVGDKVITIVNDYAEREKAYKCKDRNYDVYNGTTGIIKEYDDATGTVIVDLIMADGLVYPTKYTVDEIKTYLIPAYAVNVHKSIGSQADNVLLYIGGKASTNRNMLYTAATRAKKKLVIAGNEEMLQESVKIKARPGYTKFAFRVKNRMQNQAHKKKEVDLSRRLL